MGLGLQPAISKATYRLNCLAVRLLRQRRHLLILTYHRVGNRQQIWPEPVELAECSLEQFEQEMQWVRTYCNPVDMDTVDQIVHQGRPCPNRAVLVTFDDGYREDLLRARPGLERHGIRPTVFLPTDYIGTRRRFWWDRVGACLQITDRDHLRMDWEPDRIDLSLGTPEERDHATSHMLNLIKPLRPEGRVLATVRLEEELGVPSTELVERPLVLDWDEVRALRSVFDFDGHTKSHPVMSSLTAGEAREELATSKKIVEEQLDQPCRTMAIPYGGAADYTPETVQIASELGYSMIFSLEDTLRGPIRQGQMALVDRISLSAQAGLPGVAAKITWPSVFIPDWTGKVMGQLQRLRGR